MKIYSIIVTIVAISALGVVGYGYYTGLKIKKIISECQTQKKAYESQIQRIQSEAEQKLAEISKLAEILRESSGSFMHSGDIKASYFNPSTVEEIKNTIEDIQNNVVKESIKNKWDTFTKTASLNDYRDFIGTMADMIKTDVTPSRTKD